MSLTRDQETQALIKAIGEIADAVRGAGANLPEGPGLQYVTGALVKIGAGARVDPDEPPQPRPREIIDHSHITTNAEIDRRLAGLPPVPTRPRQIMSGTREYNEAVEQLQRENEKA